LPLPLELDVNVVDDPHRLDEQRWLRDDEHRVLHVLCEDLAAVLQRLDEREHVVADVIEHLLGRQMAKLAPAQVLTRVLGSLPGLVFPSEQRVEFLLQELGVAALFLVERIQPAHEQEVADLLNRGEGIGDSSGPELVPELVHLRTDRWRQHSVTLPTVLEPIWLRGPLPPRPASLHPLAAGARAAPCPGLPPGTRPRCRLSRRDAHDAVRPARSDRSWLPGLYESSLPAPRTPGRRGPGRPTSSSSRAADRAYGHATPASLLRATRNTSPSIPPRSARG